MISVRKNFVFKYYSHRSNVADSESYNMKILVDFEKQNQRKSEERKMSKENNGTNFSLREETKLKAQSESEVV